MAQNSTQSKNKQLTLVKKLDIWCKEAIIVEITTDDREVTGRLHEIGADYVSIVGATEKREETIDVGQDGKKEKKTHIVVHEIETLLEKCKIKSISRVLKSSYK